MATRGKSDCYIPNGCTLWARQTVESDVFFKKPDKWFKIWFFIVNQANHADNRQFKRGQCHLTYELIMLGCNATKGQVDHCIRWLKAERMLATTKAIRGFVVTVLNYGLYQNLTNYKSDSSGDLKATQKRQDKQERKNERKNICVSPTEFQSYWNSKPRLPKIQNFGSSRRTKLKTRCNEPIFAENWQLIIDKLNDSNFHTGGGERGWRADVDWILKSDSNYCKILELEDTHAEKQIPLECDKDGVTPREKFKRQLEGVAI